MKLWIAISLFLCTTNALFAQVKQNTKSNQNLPVENYISIRGGLSNFYKTVTSHQTATVAFLGGSITYNPGWRDSVYVYLQTRFPKAKFHFIMAGIPSLGSLPHAFRLQQDVLDSGKIDLLFVEAAVNDRTNKTDSITQVRDLEGIVRHAKKSNPEMDIILLSFADPEKTSDYTKGIVPTEIFNHELVASHYHLSSINLAKEVQDKMKNGEFNWEKDFKDLHPSPFGQQLYFQAIKKLFDDCFIHQTTDPFTSMPIDKISPLDKANFSNGKYIDITKATTDDNWKRIKNWTPSDSLATRDGFVHVPVLEAVKPASTLRFAFKGTAVGIAVVAGSDAGILSYAIDNESYKTIDQYTEWSSFLYLPWYLLLGSNLKSNAHILHLKISEHKNKNSKGNACRIVHFLVNE